MKDYFLFVLKNLKARQIRSWLTMIGIFIGIAAVVALIGLGEGLNNAINMQFNFLGKDIISITASGGFGPPGTGVIDPLTDKELDAARRASGVEGVAGRLLESSKIEFNKKVEFSYIASIPDREDRKVIEDLVNIKAEKGRLLKDGDQNVVFIGYGFTDKNIFGKPMAVNSKIKIQDKEFIVIGIMEKKGNFQLDRAIMMNEKDMRDLFNIADDEYDLIAVKVIPNADIKKIEFALEKELRKIRNVKEGEEDFAVQTPASILETVNSVLLAIRIFFYIIAGISLLVGGIGIMNTMYTAVIERTKEIGIMKSIGAKNSAIFTLFFIESGLLGTAGGIIGIILGILMSKGLAFAGRLALGSEFISADISIWLVLGALIFSFGLGSFFGTLPALQASKLNPVEAIRYAK